MKTPRLVHFMISIAVSLYVLLVTLFSSLAALLLSPAYQKKHDDLVIRGWAKKLLWGSGIPWAVHGLENIPSGGCLYVINHCTLMDIPLVHAALPPGIRFGAKAELFSIPIFGRAIQRVGVLEIQRANRTAVLRVYDRAAERLKAGESFVLAPQGTRQTEEKLGEFKTGPFVLAINAQVPVVPVVLTGIAPILPKSAWRIFRGASPLARVDILPPTATKGLNLGQRDELRAIVFEQMKSALAQIRMQTSSLPNQKS